MQNSDTKQTFFELLRAGLWNCPVAGTQVFHSPTDWNSIFELAQKQTVLGLIADAVFRLPEDCQPEQNTLIKLASVVSTIARRNAQINATLPQVVTLLSDKGVHSVLLKGQGIASLYPNPGLRTSGDIDLFVGKNNYHKACQLIIELIGEDIISSVSEKHLHTEVNGVTVEIHRLTDRLFDIGKDKIFQRWIDDNMCLDNTTSIMINGVEIHTPSPEFNSIYIFHHLFHHFMYGGVGLRQLCDWAMVLHTQSLYLDKDKLESQLKSFGLLEAWQLFGCILVEQLGLPEEEFPLYKKCKESKLRRILNTILCDGNFGHYSQPKLKRPTGIIAGKLHTLRFVSDRTASLFRIFPLSFAEFYLYFLIQGTISVFSTFRVSKR